MRIIYFPCGLILAFTTIVLIVGFSYCLAHFIYYSNYCVQVLALLTLAFIHTFFFLQVLATILVILVFVLLVLTLTLQFQLFSINLRFDYLSNSKEKACVLYFVKQSLKYEWYTAKFVACSSVDERNFSWKEAFFQRILGF